MQSSDQGKGTGDLLNAPPARIQLFDQMKEDDLAEVKKVPFAGPVYWDISEHDLKVSKDLMKATVDPDVAPEEHRKQVEHAHDMATNALERQGRISSRLLALIHELGEKEEQAGDPYADNDEDEAPLISARLLKKEETEEEADESEFPLHRQQQVPPNILPLAMRIAVPIEPLKSHAEGWGGGQGAGENRAGDPSQEPRTNYPVSEMPSAVTGAEGDPGRGSVS